MEIITPDKREEFLKYIRSIRDKKLVGTIDAVDSLHDGHLRIFQDVKRRSDVLVVEYTQFWKQANLYYRGYTGPLETTFEKFLNKLKEIESDVDYVVYSPMTENLWRTVIENEKYKEEFRRVHTELGIPSAALLSLTYPIHSDVVDSCTQAFAGCKCIIQDIVMRKVIPKDKLTFNPETIWKIYRHEDTGQAFARSSSNVTLGYMASKVAEELRSCNSNIEVFKEIHKSLPLSVPELSIIDFQTCKRIDEVRDNCLIVIADGSSEEFVIIKDGDLLF
jgi:hypothetical protein